MKNNLFDQKTSYTNSLVSFFVLTVEKSYKLKTLLLKIHVKKTLKNISIR